MENLEPMQSKYRGFLKKMAVLFSELLKRNLSEVCTRKKISNYALHFKDQFYSAIFTTKMLSRTMAIKIIANFLE